MKLFNEQFKRHTKGLIKENDQYKDHILAMLASGQMDNIKLAREISKANNFPMFEWAHKELYPLFNFMGLTGGLNYMLMKMHEAKTIDRYELGISYIPKAIKYLSGLEELILSNNIIKEIPEEVCQLQNLNTLSLYKNRLTKIPECIGNMPNLFYITLDHNQITELPSNLANLKQSDDVFLSLGNNKITKLPESFNGVNYWLINLEGNPISEEEKGRIKREIPDTEIDF